MTEVRVGSTRGRACIVYCALSLVVYDVSPASTAFADVYFFYLYQTFTYNTGVSCWAPNCLKLAPNGTKEGLCKISELKCTEIGLKKSQICHISDQFDPIWDLP